MTPQRRRRSDLDFPKPATRDRQQWVRWRPSEKGNCVGSMRSAEKPRRRKNAQRSPEHPHSPAADHRLRAVRWNRQHVHRVRIDLKDRVSEPYFARTPPGSQPGECQTPRWYLDVDYLWNSRQESKKRSSDLISLNFPKEETHDTPLNTPSRPSDCPIGYRH